jgi:RNA polymerase sigma factor (sigma-70 family)
MAAHTEPLLHYLQRLVSHTNAESDDDAKLLQRFVARRDEAAFAALLARHGAMVLGVCRRVLRDDHEAEDAFQATFLLLARKASGLRHPESLASWLYGTARRLALAAHRGNLRRRQREKDSVLPSSAVANPLDELSARELLVVLDDEIARLPERYRLPLILCCVEGRSQAEAARLLGWTADSLRGRLERGRSRLRARLVRRGLMLGASLLALESLAASTVSASLQRATLQAALAFGRGECAGIAATVVTLAETGLANMTMAKAKMGLVLLLAMGLVAGAGALAYPLRSERSPAPPNSHERQSEPAKSEKGERRRTDREGVPLPPGALARLGTTRLRPMASTLAFRDDRTFVTCGESRILRFWDVATGVLKKTRQLPGPNSARVILSGDGKRLALQEDEGMSVWDVDSGKRLHLLPQDASQIFVQGAFSPDGRMLATAEFSGTHAIRLWDLSTGKGKRLGKTNHFLLSMTFSPDGKRLVLAVQDRTLLCWDAANGKELWRRPQLPRGVGFAPDGRTLAVGDPTDPRHIRLIDAATGKSLDEHAFPGIRGVYRVLFSPNGKTLAIATDKGIALWDVDADKQRRFLDGADFPFAFAPDGKSLVSLGVVLQRWDAATGKPLYEDTSKLGHTHLVQRISWSPDGRRLASAGGNNFSPIYLWSVADSRLLYTLPREASGDSPGWRFTAFTPDGKYLILGGDRTVRVLGAASAREVRQWPTRDAASKDKADWLLAQCHLSHDGKTLTALTVEWNTGRQAVWLTTWDMATGKRRLNRPMDDKPLRGAVFSPDGQSIIFDDGILYDVATGKVRFKLAADGEIGDRRGGGIAFAPDGTSIASSIWHAVPKDKRFVRLEVKGIQLWRTDTGRPLMRLPVQAFCRFTFSPDGRFLVTANDESIDLWEIASAKQVFHRLVSGRVLGDIPALAFAPDGRTLATGLRDATILIWDVMPASRETSHPLSAAQLDRLWTDLAASDAALAYRALGRSIAHPSETLPLLRERLHPLTAIPTEDAKRFLADLDSEQFARREAASQRLADLGERVEPALREALDKKPSLELRRRIEHLLARLSPEVIDAPEMLRELRAVCVLEQIDTPESRRQLEALAKGMATARLTREAKAALGRLAAR